MEIVKAKPKKINNTIDDLNIFYSPVLDKNQQIVDIKIDYKNFIDLLYSFGFRRFDIDKEFFLLK